MLFYLFLGPLEGLKSRPFHHCLFSSDLARPKKITFLRAQTNCSWPPAYFSFSASLLRDALLICRMTWSGCGTNWSATSCPQMFHRITKSPWMAAIFRKSDVKAKHLRRPAMTKYSRGGLVGWYIHCEKSPVFEPFVLVHQKIDISYIQLIQLIRIPDFLGGWISCKICLLPIFNSDQTLCHSTNLLTHCRDSQFLAGSLALNHSQLKP